MRAAKAAKIRIDYHNAHSKKNAAKSCQALIGRFCQDFGDAEPGWISSDQILSFLNRVSNCNKPYTKRVR